ncbi:MAG TPA: HD domain-containing phosphohydrolase [Tepidisphaeraceae bacterium]|jgi:putative two-component system response regulator|nr:HD domain-containing phosphohydrolase [Tepidisphaeraceae bacterium]
MTSVSDPVVIQTGIQPLSVPCADPTGVVAEAARQARALAKIAIIDDEPINIKVVRKHLQAEGYRNFVTTTDASTALELIRREEPDVVLLDVMMPVVNGIDILRAVRADANLTHIPVLILTASTDAQTKRRALESGATDFLAKPVDPSDLAPRIGNALIVKAHHDHLEQYSEQLEQQVRLRTEELEVSRLQVVLCLARAAEYRDDTTGRHVIRVGRYVTILARQLGFCEAESQMLGLAAQLHDVGKIGLPDGILLKPGKLTPGEFEVVKRHCEMGHKIVQPVHDDDLEFINGVPVPPPGSDVGAPLVAMAGRIALSHHERWDGKGYPLGLSGADIPIEGRITSVADVFDALTSARPYKDAYSPARSLEIMEEGRGSQFDPAILDAMHQQLNEFLRICHEQADPLTKKAA